MNPARFLLPFAIALTGCADTSGPVSPPPSDAPRSNAGPDNGAAPNILAGSKLLYSDLHSRNTYEFKTDGSFIFDYVHHGSGDSGRRDGTYRYRITGPGKARVDFDDGDFMLLEFETPLSGICVFDGDVRRYGFSITRPDGE